MCYVIVYYFIFSIYAIFMHFMHPWICTNPSRQALYPNLRQTHGATDGFADSSGHQLHVQLLSRSIGPSLWSRMSSALKMYFMTHSRSCIRYLYIVVMCTTKFTECWLDALCVVGSAKTMNSLDKTRNLKLCRKAKKRSLRQLILDRIFKWEHFPSRARLKHLRSTTLIAWCNGAPLPYIHRWISPRKALTSVPVVRS